MKILNGAIAAAIISTFAASAQAQDSDAYVNVGVQTYEFDTYNIVGRVGYNFSEYFGVEGEGSVGVIGEEEDFFGETIEFDTKYSLGGYLVARYPASDQFSVFVRAGYTTVNVEISGGGESEDENFDGFAIGGGLQYNFDAQNGVRLGYTYNDGDGIEADVIDLTYVRNF